MSADSDVRGFYTPLKESLRQELFSEDILEEVYENGMQLLDGIIADLSGLLVEAKRSKLSRAKQALSRIERNIHRWNRTAPSGMKREIEQGLTRIKSEYERAIKEAGTAAKSEFDDKMRQAKKKYPEYEDYDFDDTHYKKYASIEHASEKKYHAEMEKVRERIDDRYVNIYLSFYKRMKAKLQHLKDKVKKSKKTQKK